MAQVPQQYHTHSRVCQEENALLVLQCDHSNDEVHCRHLGCCGMQGIWLTLFDSVTTWS